MKSLYLVDASSLFFRAFFAVRQLQNSRGLPTNAIYGFLSMSIKLLEEMKPDYMVYCYDQPTASFRKDLYEDYKANRTEMPEELALQIPYIKKLTDLMGIPSVGKEGYEADDLIGSLSRFGQENKLEVTIVSGDKDFAQLINPQVRMYDTMKEKIYGEAQVLERWGVRPDQFIDYLAITGDSSDNIPGVRGIGPKGAQQLLSHYGSLDGIYENIHGITPASKAQKLMDSKDEAYLSQKLVTIVKDLDLFKDLHEMTLQPIDKEKLGEVLDELEFTKFKKTLLGQDPSGSKEPPSISQAPLVVVSKTDAQGLESWLHPGDEVFIWREPRWFFIIKGRECRMVEDSMTQVGQVMATKELSWSGFDIKSSWRELGITQGQIKSDLMLSAYLLKAGPIKSLAEICSLYVKHSLPENPEPMDIYQAFRATEEVVLEKLKAQKMLPILQTLDIPLVEVLCSMEAKGVQLDTFQLARESEFLEKEIATVEKEIKALAGEDFNVASPKQLAVILFEKMGLTKGKKTKTGYSTATDVLEKLVKESPIAQKILDFREFTKLKSTYVDALPELVNGETGRVHTVFNQALTTTGRLSSNHPNLQNIPIRTERGRRVREAFVAPEGHKMLSADYSQIELRVLAHITGDQGLTQAFNEDRDIHAWTASEIFNQPIREVSFSQRRMAKAVNFGIAYGQGVYGLAETLKISRTESKDIIQNYFAKFPGVKTYMDQVVEQAKEKGYVETLFGRRRYLPELSSNNPRERAFGERAAINAPIQGTASDLVKMAMLEVHESYGDFLLLQAHDELIFQLPEKDIQAQAQHIKDIMENNVELNVRLKVNVAWGDHWAEAH